MEGFESMLPEQNNFLCQTRSRPIVIEQTRFSERDASAAPLLLLEPTTGAEIVRHLCRYEQVQNVQNVKDSSVQGLWHCRIRNYIGMVGSKVKNVTAVLFQDGFQTVMAFV